MKILTICCYWLVVMRSCAGFKYNPPAVLPFPPPPRPGKEKCEEEEEAPPLLLSNSSPHLPRGKIPGSRKQKKSRLWALYKYTNPTHRPRTAESSRRLSGVFPPGLGFFFPRSGRRFPATVSSPSLGVVSLIDIRVCSSFFVFVPIRLVDRSRPACVPASLGGRAGRSFEF